MVYVVRRRAAWVQRCGAAPPEVEALGERAPRGQLPRVRGCVPVAGGRLPSGLVRVAGAGGLQSSTPTPAESAPRAFFKELTSELT